MLELLGHRRKDHMKITKINTQKIKDDARAEKQRIMRSAGKTFTTAQKKRMKELNGIIEQADKIIGGR